MVEGNPRVDGKRLPTFEVTMKSLQSGDETIWSVVYERFSPMMQKSAKRLVGDDAEVVVQEVWTNLFRRFSKPEFDPFATYESTAHFRASLVRSSVNRALDVLAARSRRVEEVAGNRPLLYGEESNYEEYINGTVTGRMLQLSLPGLVGKGAAEVFELFAAEYDVAGAAKKLGVPTGTVKSRAFNGRQKARSSDVIEVFSMITDEPVAQLKSRRLKKSPQNDLGV